MSVELKNKYSSLDGDTVCRANPEVVFRRIGEETILVPVKRSAGDMSAIWALNEVASVIWQQLNGEHTLREMAGIVSDAYEVGPDEALADVSEIVSEMLEVGLLDCVEATPKRNG